jgi:hypothetical protein
MLAVDGSKVGSAIAGAAIMTAVFAVFALAFAVVCAVGGIRMLRAGRDHDDRGQRTSGLGCLVLAGALVLGVGAMGWSWVRYGLDGRDADRATQAGVRTAQMCERQYFDLLTKTDGNTHGFVPDTDSGTSADGHPTLVSHDDWLARCQARNSKIR